ncbi:MAG: alpha/beta hydrolase [Candidatus Protistobacter heckmanni]|nr:alpha/beta hydrolase [Candidatus Protistobacter heckmanni]
MDALQHAKPRRKAAPSRGKPALRVTNLSLLVAGGPVPLRIYQPVDKPGANRAAAKLPAVLYFHGGGFVGGDLDDAETPASHIAANTPAVVVSVGYSLAPHKPFPAAPEDAYAAAWVFEQADSLGVDPARLAAAGDDAGGSLAAALAMMARDRGRFAIAAQALIGPMLDPSMTRMGDAKRLNSDMQPEDCAVCYRQYLPAAAQRMHPYAAPLESRRLAGLPAALVVTAECDVLHNEAEKYAAELISASVHTQVARLPKVKHGELHTHARARAEVSDFLRRRLHAAGSAHAYAIEQATALNT